MNILAFSDTHTLHNRVILDEENIDVIIHCGDFTSSRHLESNKIETHEFLDWFSSLNIKHKILIAGNHEFYLSFLDDLNEIDNFFKQNYPNLIYLKDSSTIIDGIKFYGTPWSNEYGKFVYQLDNEKKLNKKYNKIDLDTNILISHNPSYGILDYVYGRNTGSTALSNRLKKLKKLSHHFHGHIHECFGFYQNKNYITINVSFLSYLKDNQPKIITI